MGNANHRAGCGKDILIPYAPSGPPLLFHQTHSPSIRLSIDRCLAKRFDGTKGICFSNRPVRVGELIAFKVLETANSRNGALRFGLSCEDPESIETEELAQYASPDVTCEQGYWAKGIPERLVQRGNVLGFWLSPEGEVHYGCNGNRHGVFFQGVDVKCPLWGLFDVFGSTISISIIDVEQPILNNVEMPRVTSTGQKNATPDLSRTSSSASVPLQARSQSAQPRRSSRDSTGPSDAPTSSHTNPLDCCRETRSAGSTPTIASNSCTTKILPNRIPQDFSASRNPWNQLDDPGVSQRLHEPMQFHYAIGRNICLSSDRMIATRLSEDYCNGYVFTSRPIRPGEKLVIEVAAVDLDYVGGLAFGMTACDPAEVRVAELPDDSDQLLDRPEYWVVHKDVCVKPEVGDLLTFYLTRKGEVRFSRNRCPVAMLMHVDISLELWVFIDVYGTTQRIKSCGVTSRITTTKNLKAPASDPGCQFTKSLARLNLTTPLRPLQSQSTVEAGAANGCDPTTLVARNLKPGFNRMIETQQVVPKETCRVASQHTLNPFFDISADPPMVDHPITPLVNRRTASVLSRGHIAPPVSDPFSDVPVALPPPLIPVPAPNSRPANSVERPQPTLSVDATLDFHSSPQFHEIGPTLDGFRSTNSVISGSSDCLEILRNFQEPAKPSKVSGNVSERTVHPSENLDSESSANECVVCWENVPDCALYMCGHMCMCYECAQNVLKKQGALCPICRQPVRDVIRIFKS